MKISIELTEDGELNIDTGEEELDILTVNGIIDIAKLSLVTSLYRGMGEEVTTPEEVVEDDEVSL